jgi:hypothetical protein
VNGSVPFSVLQITNGVWKDKTVARTNCLNDPAGNIVPASGQVRLVNSMEFGTTACNLKLVSE